MINDEYRTLLVHIMIGSQYKSNNQQFFEQILLGDLNIEMWINLKLCCFELIGEGESGL